MGEVIRLSVNVVLHCRNININKEIDKPELNTSKFYVALVKSLPFILLLKSEILIWIMDISVSIFPCSVRNGRDYRLVFANGGCPLTRG